MIESVFYPDRLVRTLRHNADNELWARQARDRITTAARSWQDCPDELLWDSMFGPALKRSWMVWSSGHCPACRGDVSMYGWEIDPCAHPWKVTCPHCAEHFPKNDFRVYYESGLNARGVFDPDQADRSLLSKSGDEHGEEDARPAGFGVDDGNGYTNGENTWMFIATYLIYGQWKQSVHAGIVRLADAYTVTGDIVYARKAGILLDRVADLYPEFDFAEQGWLYERKPDLGYVTNWHDACREVTQMANAYDQVRPALLEDSEFVTFVQNQASKYQLPFVKDTAEDIATHIEDRIFRDTQQNVHKIKSNFPGQEIALITMEAVLQRTLQTGPIQQMVDAMLSEAVAVDDVTGEKGLENYSAIVLHYLANFLAALERMSPGYLAEQIARHPGLARTYRFHIDTWCLERFYPSIGDSGNFATEAPEYRGLPFVREVSLQASAFSLAWKLYELTGDADYARILYLANERSFDGLPYEMTESNPGSFQAALRRAIDTHRDQITPGSVNFEAWHLAILRSGSGDHRRAFWMSYDTGRRHGHLNGLNIGLFAHGLDLLPDFGYLPVHRGGWSGPHVDWYKSTAAHNSVTIDNQNQALDTEGETRVWTIGETVQAVKVIAPAMYTVPRYERTCLMVTVDAEHFYIIDIFEVDGGHDHTFFLRGPESALTTHGLTLSEDEPLGHGTQIRNHRVQECVPAGWSVAWRHTSAPVSVRYTGLSEGLSVGTAESWVSKGSWSYEDLWIPTLMVRNRTTEGELSTTFVGVIDVYDDTPAVDSVERSADVGGVEIKLHLITGEEDTIRLGERGAEIQDGMQGYGEVGFRRGTRGQ